MGTFLIAIVLVLIKLSQVSHDAYDVTHIPSSFVPPYFLAFGTMMFAYGGAGSFPTIQQDMKKPHHFNKVLPVAYLGKWISL
jgi:vesicular inhibitory amino acid transporter